MNVEATAEATSTRSLLRTPTATERRAMRTVASLLDNIDTGEVTVYLPDGRRRCFGVPDATLTSDIRVHDWAFFRRLLTGGSVGVGESYMRGEWSSSDLVGLIQLVIANRSAMRKITPSALLNIATDKIFHATHANRIGQSEDNIRAHYDLSNELYELFLDPTMTYSSAVFDDPDDSLEDAQLNKYRLLAQKARISADTHVLEIGCGWGGFASYAAAKFGCKVTGITLSHEQAAYARERMVREGIDHLVDIQIVDYRLVEGTFDRIVSIEMLEAVGHRFLGTYFETIDRLLSDYGLAAIQVITIPEQRYGNYLRRPDFIQKYIFPGGHIPSLEAMGGAMGDDSKLYVDDVDNIGIHYAETLRRWRINFLDNEEAVRALGFDDRFIRMWEFYLAYCEGAFLARYINDLQLVLTRTMNPTLGADPYGGRTPIAAFDTLVEVGERSDGRDDEGEDDEVVA